MRYPTKYKLFPSDLLNCVNLELYTKGIVPSLPVELFIGHGRNCMTRFVLPRHIFVWECTGGPATQSSRNKEVPGSQPGGVPEFLASVRSPGAAVVAAESYLHTFHSTGNRSENEATRYSTTQLCYSQGNNLQYKHISYF